ncbi:MAG: cupin domain-containing protein [Candidatus Limnocylindria bacterium]
MIEPRLVDIKRAAKENTFFRKVLHTSPKTQVVVMSLEPGEDIGAESHDGDQLLYAVKGRGTAVFSGVQEPFEKGTLICVPSGLRTTSSTPATTLSGC